MGWTILRVIIKFFRSLTWSDLLQFIISVIIAVCLVSIFSCSSVQTSGGGVCTKGLNSYSGTIDELKDILKHDPLTDKQKVIVNHAIDNLKDAKKQNTKTEKLQEQLIKSSEKAGAGKLVYNIMYFVIFLIVAFAGFKIMKKFSFF